MNSSILRAALPFTKNLHGFLSLPKAATQLASRVRTVYSASALGIDEYLKTRYRLQPYFETTADEMKQRLKEYVDHSSTMENSMLADDLKNILHFATNNAEDVSIIINAFSKFNNDKEATSRGSFVYGPIVMRFFHHFKLDDNALLCFTDSKFHGLFDQNISYQILLDLLHKKARYQDVIDQFESIKASCEEKGHRIHKTTTTIVFASCYKLNTPESLSYSINLLKEKQTKNEIVSRKSVTFTAGLALKQNAPQIALNLVGELRQQNYVTVRNIKAIAMARLGRFGETNQVLRSVLEVFDAGTSQKTHSIPKDVLDRIGTEVEASNQEDFIKDFHKIRTYLEDNGHVVPESLDSLLCQEIKTGLRDIVMNRDRSALDASFRNNRYAYTPNKGQNERKKRSLFRDEDDF